MSCDTKQAWPDDDDDDDECEKKLKASFSQGLSNSSNQSSYRESRRPTDCIKLWFGLDHVQITDP